MDVRPQALELSPGGPLLQFPAASTGAQAAYLQEDPP